MTDILPLPRLAPKGPLAQTAYGPVLGAVLNGVHCFRGVPFAAPPLGPLRFLPPQPPAPWQEVLDCQSFRDSAVQAAEITPAITHSEDCLYLNIWAPAEASPGDGRAVLVYIHGGGFSEGSPAKAVFDGSAFAKSGILQVNLSYRLGALGFMAFEEIEAEHGYLGNCGLLDQIAALQWVQENIAFFGGDPGNVTICGESAGAFSVSALLLSPLAKGLFKRAILQSGNILGQPILAPMARGGRRSAIVSSRSYAAALRHPSLTGLRKMDARAITRGCAFRDNLTDPPKYNFWPVFDGRLLPQNPYEALCQGQLNAADLLLGYNSDEGTLFIPKGTTGESYFQLCLRIFGEDAYEVLRRFPIGAGHTPASRARALVEMGLRFGSDVYADEYSRQGQRVWAYNFNHHIPVLDGIGLGITHALELFFVFKTLPKLFLRNPAHGPVMEDIHIRWLNFIRTGDPNQGDAVSTPWPAYTQQEKQTLILQAKPAPRTAPLAQDVAFYRDILWGERSAAM